MGWAEAELSLTLLSDRAMAALNRQTFGRRGPTNVIAFPVDVPVEPGPGGQGPAASAPSRPAPPLPLPEVRPWSHERPPAAAPAGQGQEGGDFQAAGPPSLTAPTPPLLLGEVVISPETTARQAREFGWPYEELFDFFLIHGILHLLGYDHDTPEREAAMEAKARELLAALGGGGENAHT